MQFQDHTGEGYMSITITATEWSTWSDGAMDAPPPGKYAISGNTFTGTNPWSSSPLIATLNGNVLTVGSGSSARIYNRSGFSVPGTSLATKLQWVQANAADGCAYIIELTANETIASQTISYPGKKKVEVFISGSGGERTITPRSGTLFTLDSGVHLEIKDIAIRAGSERAVRINGSSQFTMRENTKITGGSDGAVYVSDGTFSMYGGEISGNTARSSGGAVHVENGHFSFYNGTIRDNKAEWGGGVSLAANGIIYLQNGTISGNTASRGGGGINSESVNSSMYGGVITGNTTEGSGGGIRLGAGLFYLIGGTISGNSARHGGGVDAGDGATFTMQGGDIRSNRSTHGGGGVGVAGRGTFTKNGGTIHGDNTGVSGSNAVGGARQRNSAAGTAVNLNSAVAGAAGGWEAAGSTAAPANFNGTWEIHLTNGRVVELQSRSRTNGTPIQQGNRVADSQQQQWRFALQDDGTYTIFNVLSGLVMDVQSSRIRENGALVQQWTNNNNPNMRWRIIQDGEFVKFQNASSGKLLDMSRSNFNRVGHQFHQWDDNGGDNQKFRLVKVN